MVTTTYTDTEDISFFFLVFLFRFILFLSELPSVAGKQQGMETAKVLMVPARRKTGIVLVAASVRPALKY
jgi:hypothetical protein